MANCVWMDFGGMTQGCNKTSQQAMNTILSWHTTRYVMPSQQKSPGVRKSCCQFLATKGGSTSDLNHSRQRLTHLWWWCFCLYGRPWHCKFALKQCVLPGPFERPLQIRHILCPRNKSWPCIRLNCVIPPTLPIAIDDAVSTFLHTDRQMDQKYQDSQNHFQRAVVTQTNQQSYQPDFGPTT